MSRGREGFVLQTLLSSQRGKIREGKERERVREREGLKAAVIQYQEKTHPEEQKPGYSPTESYTLYSSILAATWKSQCV